MKPYIFALGLFCILATPAVSQTTSEAKVSISAETDFRQIFSSKIIEFNAALSRNAPELASNVYKEISKLMQQSLAWNREALNQNSTEEDKARINQVVEEQTRLYGELKTLSADVVKNQKAITRGLESFQKTI
jgi:hypothetical protein